ncbi:MAG: peptidoglycan DD-metalloendopeptidase family protein, partial [Rhodospirillales bacterium]|nr:peptidoglycan DD-metalloendopeptidase family protein [Rhodospirillales bacterium]
QAAKQATARASARLASLEKTRRQAAARLEANTRALTPLLPLIERLSLYPAETLLAAPVPPEQALRGVVILRGLTHELAARAARIAAGRARLAAATRAVAGATPALEAAEAEQAAAAAELDRQIAAANADRLAAGKAATSAAQRAAQLAAQARSLRDLLARLEAAQREAAQREAAQREAARREAARRAAERAAAAARQGHAPATGQAGAKAPAAEPDTGTPDTGLPAGPIHLVASARPRHQLLRPVAGRLVSGWGDRTPAGPATGIAWRAAPGARVVAPCSGKVLFAAPFEGYGKLLIVDCGGGYDAVITGFARLDVTVGGAARAGAVVGTLADGSRRPKLYMELRHKGSPVDPAPWLHGGA